MGKLKNSHAMLLALLLMINACLGYCYPPMQSYADTERAATVRASSLNIRSGPGTTYSSVAKLSQGMAVTVIGEKKASDGALWYQIRFHGNQTGYALGSYIRFPVQYTNDSGFEAYLSAQGFPESYKVGLRQLHAQYPNWVFTAQHTNLDWNTVIANESIVGRSLIHKNNVSSWKSIADGAYDWTTGSWPGFDGSAWVAASEEIVRYYMDPRNFLDDTYVFQFLLQSYNSSVHTTAGLETMVKGTFLESKASTGTHTDSGSNGDAGSNVGPGVAPGTNTTPGTNTAPGTNTTPGTNLTTGSGDNNVRLEAPGASISSRYQNRVTTAIGPGMTGG
ncbi:MAG: SH3 domain-containing protein, partial [Bacteroides sp.]